MVSLRKLNVYIEKARNVTMKHAFETMRIRSGVWTGRWFLVLGIFGVLCVTTAQNAAGLDGVAGGYGFEIPDPTGPPGEPSGPPSGGGGTGGGGGISPSVGFPTNGGRADGIICGPPRTLRG